VNNTLSINAANTTTTQNFDVPASSSLLVNDLPTGTTIGARLTTAPEKSGGTGAVTLSCPTALGTAATPSVTVGSTAHTICTNGRFRVALAGNQAAKRGTITFTYTTTVNGVASTPATVTITVN
jgi:hypothetical protein